MSFPTALEDLLEANRIAVRSLIKLEFGGATYGFWNGPDTITVEGQDYLPNTLIAVGEPIWSTGTAAMTFTLTLPARADFGLTPDMLSLIEDEDYKGRPVTVSDAYFHPDTRELLHVEPMLYGYIDTIDHTIADGEAALVANVASGALDNHRDGYRSASSADQQLVSAGDLFFDYASLVKNEHFKIKLKGND